jgi:hypothetical protein
MKNILILLKHCIYDGGLFMKIAALAFMTILNFNFSQAATSSFFDVPILVQEIKHDGSVSNQFLDILQKKSGTEHCVPQSTPFTVMRFYGMCISMNSSDCTSSVQAVDRMAFFASVTNGRKEPERQYLPAIQNFEIKSTTKIINDTNDTLTIEISAVYQTAAVPIVQFSS